LKPNRFAERNQTAIRRVPIRIFHSCAQTRRVAQATRPWWSATRRPHMGATECICDTTPLPTDICDAPPGQWPGETGGLWPYRADGPEGSPVLPRNYEICGLTWFFHVAGGTCDTRKAGPRCGVHHILWLSPAQIPHFPTNPMISYHRSIKAN
jgi:hypothetical protein